MELKRYRKNVMKPGISVATVKRNGTKSFGKRSYSIREREKRRKYSGKKIMQFRSGKVSKGFKKMAKVYLSKQLQMQKWSQ